MVKTVGERVSEKEREREGIERERELERDLVDKQETKKKRQKLHSQYLFRTHSIN